MNLLLTVIFIVAIDRRVHEKKEKGGDSFGKGSHMRMHIEDEETAVTYVYKVRTTTSAVCGVRNNSHWMRSGSRRSEISLLKYKAHMGDNEILLVCFFKHDQKVQIRKEEVEK